MQKIALLLLCCSASWLSAQSGGEIDLSFGNQGFSVQDQYTFETITSFVVQADEKVVAAGFTEENDQSEITVLRYLPGGALDESFANHGIFVHALQPSINVANAITLQPDGKIIVVGYSLNEALGNFKDDIFVLRLDIDGKLDSTFSADGIATFDLGVRERAVDVEVSPAGNIYVAGNTFDQGISKFLLCSFDQNGALDLTFGTDGYRTLQFADESWNYCYAMSLQPDGKILLSGESPTAFSDANFTLMRVNPDGQLDASFSNDGMASNSISLKDDIALAMAIFPDGKILLGGYAIDDVGKTNFALMWYTSAGFLDNTFGTGGKVITPVGNGYGAISALCITPQEEILAVGTAKRYGTYFDFVLAKYDANGNISTDFGDQGLVYTDIDKHYDGVCDAKTLPDGKIMVGGAGVKTDNSISECILARYWFEEQVGVGNLINILSSTWIYPNPTTKSIINIEYTLLEAGEVEIELFSLKGERLGLLSQKTQSIGRQRETLQLPPDLAPGLYLTQIRSKTNQVTVKIMVH